MGEEEQGREKEEPKIMRWVSEVYENLDYYLGTEEGRRKLEEIAREEAERLAEEIVRIHKPQRDIIWMSKWCLKCKFFREQRGRYYCDKHNVRLVKPFYGKPMWIAVAEGEGESRYVLVGLDWDEKWRAVEEFIVEAAMAAINKGRPYYCYEPAGEERE